MTDTNPVEQNYPDVQAVPPPPPQDDLSIYDDPFPPRVDSSGNARDLSGNARDLSGNVREPSEMSHPQMEPEVESEARHSGMPTGDLYDTSASEGTAPSDYMLLGIIVVICLLAIGAVFYLAWPSL